MDKENSHDHIESNSTRSSLVERDENEMPVLSGAVMHVLSSNGMRNCDSTKCGIIQKGKIIKNSEMGKKKNESMVSAKQNGVENYDDSHYAGAKHNFSENQKMNGLDYWKNEVESKDLCDKTRK